MLLVLNNIWAPNTAISGPEGGQVNRSASSISKGRNADSLSLEEFERAWRVQKALTATADKSNGSPSKFGQICADVHGCFARPITMHSSKAAGSKYFDTGKMGEDYSAGDSCATVILWLDVNQRKLELMLDMGIQSCIESQGLAGRL